MPDFLQAVIKLINWASVMPATMMARGSAEAAPDPLPSGSSSRSARGVDPCSVASQTFGISARPTISKTVPNFF